MRTFLAVELPRAAVRALAGWVDRQQPRLPGWRWLRSDGWHVTLRFLGATRSEQQEELGAAWAAALSSAPAFSCRVEACGLFPARGTPRVLWAGFDAEGAAGLTELAGRLERRAVECGFSPSDKRYTPHVTLARARRGARAARPADDLPPPRIEFGVRRVVWLRSHLLPEGARYETLGRFALRGD